MRLSGRLARFCGVPIGALCVPIGIALGTPDAFAQQSPWCESITAPPGAVYVYGDVPDPVFSGNSFGINGNDVNYTDGLSGPMPAVWAVAARSEQAVEDIRNSLDAQQMSNLQGRGYVPGSPATPSVGVEASPSPAEIDQAIDELLALGPPYVSTYSSSQIVGSAQFGTEASPRITYFNNASGVTFGNGNVVGYGIMIVEHSLTVNGNIDFVGLILVRGPAYLVAVTSSAQVWGSLWTTNLQLTCGHCDLQYSSDALELAEYAGAAHACDPSAPTPTKTPTPSHTPSATQLRPTPTRTPNGTATPACGAAPAARCRTPPVGNSSLTLNDRRNDAKDGVAWRWRSIDPYSTPRFGDPVTTTDYEFCVYDATTLVLAASIPPAGMCSAKPCWTQSDRGFKYRNRSLIPDGVRQLTLATDGGSLGVVDIRLKARGVNVDMPTLPLALPVRAQLKNTDGVCWEATYSAPRRNDDGKFSGRID